MKSLFSTAILSLCSGLSVFLFTHFIPQQNELLLSPFFFFFTFILVLHLFCRLILRIQLGIMLNGFRILVPHVKKPHTHTKESFQDHLFSIHSLSQTLYLTSKQIEVLVPSQKGQVRKQKCLGDPVTGKKSYCNSAH